MAQRNRRAAPEPMQAPRDYTTQARAAGVAGAHDLWQGGPIRPGWDEPFTPRPSPRAIDTPPGVLHDCEQLVGGHPERTPDFCGRGPKNYRRSDERIREDLCEALIAATHLDASDVTVEVADGVITLEGIVPERRMKHAIEDIAADCPGVSDVRNHIRVVRGGAEPLLGR